METQTKENYLVFGKTDIGKKRLQNQDHYACLPEFHFFVLADGMGGHRGGEIASSEAVEEISQWVHHSPTSTQPEEISSFLSEGIQKANKRVYEKAQNNPNLQGMGTTFTALLFQKNLLTIGQVGDSRCYYCRPSGLWQLTRDHSLAQEKFQAGLITRAELKREEAKNIITRSVGYEAEVKPEIYQMEVQAGDCFLICSDGLSSFVSQATLFEIIDTFFFKKKSMEETVQKLIAAANETGGYDNVTSILIQFMPSME